MKKFAKNKTRIGRKVAQKRTEAINSVIEMMEPRVFLSGSPFTVSQTLPSNANQETYEDSGPYHNGSGYLALAGQHQGTLYQSFGALDFPVTTLAGQHIDDVQSLELDLYNTTGAGTTGYDAVAGSFNVYLATDTTTALATGTGGGAFDTSGSGEGPNNDGTNSTNSFGAGVSTQLIGNFTFSGATGYNDMVFTPSAAMDQQIANALNSSSQDVRLIVAGVGSTAADFDAYYTGHSAVLKLTGDDEASTTPQTESYSIGATAATNGVTVNEAAGTVEVDVTRSGYLNDSSTLYYETTAGTATDGVNYSGTNGAATGQVSFAAGQSTAEITVPITETGFSGAKTFNVTLTSDTPSQYNSTASIASPASATVTIVGTGALTNNIGPTLSSSVTDIETSGPYSSNYAAVNGSTTNGTGSYSYLSYEVAQFAPTSGETVTSLSNLSLQLYNSNNTAGANYDGHPGDFNIYYLSSSGPATSALTYNSSAVDGVGNLTGATLLGTFSFQNSFGYDTYSLANLTTAESNAIINDLNNSGVGNARFIIAPGSANFAADFEGEFNSTVEPTLSMTGTIAANVNSSYSVGNAAFTNGVSVNQNNTSGVVEIDVNRTGFTGDATTLNYTLGASGDTAVNGTDYTDPNSGSVSFAAGQTQAEIDLSISNAAAFTGTKDFTVTLSGVSNAQAGDTATIGSQNKALVTIVGAGSLTNNVSDAPSGAGAVTDIETSGPYASAYAPVNGSISNGTGSFSYLSYEVVTLSPTDTASIFPVAGSTVTGLSNLSLSMYNTNSSTHTNGAPDNYGGIPGDFNVYYLDDSTAATSSLKFDSTVTDGVSSLPGAVLLGTFSFSNNSGYDVFTPASLSQSVPGGETVQQAIINDLNTGTPIRLAVAPGSANFAADWSGVYAGETPTVSLTDSISVNQTPETISFQSATYSESEAGPAATITLTRSGPVGDTATVDVSTSDGNAVAGTNYTALTNYPVTFAQNSATATFTVTPIDAANQGGDKFLNLALSNPSTGSPSDIGVLGSPSTATLTITDASTAPTETFTGITPTDASDVEAGGPYDDTEIKATDISSKYPSYGAVDFAAPTTANPVTAIDSVTLTVTNKSSGGVSGEIEFYLASDTTDPIYYSPQSPTPLHYDSSQGNQGIATSGGQLGNLTSLGTYQYNDTVGGDTLTIPLAYGSAGEAALVNAINSGTPIRIVMTAVSNNVEADFLSNGATLSIKVQEGSTAPTLPGWLSVSSGGQVTWNQSGETLMVQSGTATIVADPNESAFNSGAGDEPVITVDNGATLNIAPTDGSLMVHIGGLTLNSGATAVVQQLQGPSVYDQMNGEFVASTDASNHEVLVIGKLGAANDPTFSIDPNSTLNMENNDLIIHTGSNDGGGYNELAYVQGLAYGSPFGTGVGGRAGGAWNGKGLTSSVAQAQDYSDGNESVQLAVVDNTDLGSPFNTTSNKYSVGSASEGLNPNGDIIVKYTYTGDFNLAGSVTSADVNIFGLYYDAGSSTGNEWAYGDTNNDGKLNATDANILGLDYGNGTANGTDPYQL